MGFIIFGLKNGTYSCIDNRLNKFLMKHFQLLFQLVVFDQVEDFIDDLPQCIGSIFRQNYINVLLIVEIELSKTIPRSCLADCLDIFLNFSSEIVLELFFLSYHYPAINYKLVLLS